MLTTAWAALRNITLSRSAQHTSTCCLLLLISWPTAGNLYLWDLLGLRVLELEALAMKVVAVTTSMLIFAKTH